ncbi:hypothetical protein [Rhizobium sp. BG4]|jgi:hypothetical protein|uniref:hypothetical protein n=1 Tax=Rhizobium sp. BG4 TaxID=2613770 RepID=UPI00193E64B4|nr:hypothetical protein [Rhizobium sp. BG4]QRM47001.1 hypothetical protein F2982_27185 [Rhizobium sp. BG4]
MSSIHRPSAGPVAINASVVALVVFLCGVLYFFGAAMSGDTQITKSVAGADVIDTRDVPN